MRSVVSLGLMVLGLMLVAPSASGSSYPADFSVYVESPVWVGPISVVRSVQAGGAIVLDITYVGELARANEPLWLTAVVNYMSGQRVKTFRMEHAGKGTFKLRLTTGCLAGESGRCTKFATDDMRDLLYWAANYYHLNALDIQFAVSNVRGEWDSDFGRNYRFSFSPAL
jgi:hypothetical protein